MHLTFKRSVKYVQNVQKDLWILLIDSSESVCDETQNLNDTDSETFFGTKVFRDRFRDFFRYQNFRDRFQDFFRYSFFSRPVPRLFSVPNFFETGSDTIKKVQKSRERDETGTQINTNILKDFETGSNIFFRYQIFSRPIPRLFWAPNYFKTGSETFFGTNFFLIPVPRLFSVPNNFDSGSDTIKKTEEFPGTGCHTLL